MNRIILVGNGFDLAHNLKTSYNDFLNDYWANWLKLLKNDTRQDVPDGLCTFSINHRYSDNWHSLLYRRRHITTIDQIFTMINDNADDFSLSKTPFFQEINKIAQSVNWVDIEGEYYRFLIGIVLGKISTYGKSENITAVSVNNELKMIQTKLTEYLSRIQAQNKDEVIINGDIMECMMAPLCAKEIAIEAQKAWIDFINRRLDDDSWKDRIKIRKPLEFGERLQKVNDFKKVWGDQIDGMGIESIEGGNLPPDLLYPDRTMLLNFNYTNTADLYMPDDEGEFPVNHIHGSLDKPDSVIFGYGDELDNKYQEISNLNNNELLKNMKSIRYLESDNYRNMLTFIESAPYQIYIMGHSCGISDRTLLNTLFEHPNCVSIKPFYHQKADGQDNYIEIVQNISRNFNDPKKMRDRVVNKTYCQPLPQYPIVK